MDHITIPIPEGLPEDRKSEIVGWLTDLARQVTSDGPSLDDDPAIRAEAIQRIKRGMVDVETGRFCDSSEARRRLDGKLNLDTHE